MKKFLKQLAFFSAFVILFNIVAIADNTAENADVISDDINIIKALGLVDVQSTLLKPDDIVTRAQFVNIISNLIGLYNNSSMGEENCSFIDVNNNYWCASQIYFLNSLKIINGENKYQFKPDKNITYSQAIKVLVAAMGYDVEAHAFGGYPIGYLTVASRLHITSGINMGMNDSISYETAAKLICQSLDVEIMKIAGYSPDVTYEVIENRTLLSYYHDIYKASGIMTDNGYTTLTGDSKVGVHSVEIDDTVYGKGDTNASDFIGYNTELYYKYNDGNHEIVYIMPKALKSDVLVLKADDLNKDSNKFTETSIAYETDGRNEYAVLDTYVDVIYNGRSYPIFDADTLKISTGKLTLIDNDNDSVYDVVAINEYDNCFVNSVDVSGNKIWGKYGNSIDLDLYKHITMHDITGRDIALKTIKANSIVSFEESKDKSLISLTVVEQNVKGDITAIENDGDITMMKIFMGDKEYLLAPSYKKALDGGVLGIEKPNLNKSYSFYLDIDGKIAAVDFSGGIQYAFLVKAAAAESKLNSDFAQFRLFMPNEDFVNVCSTKYVRINGETKDALGNKYKGSDILKLSCIKDGSGNFKPQVICCELNPLGELTAIEFPESAPNAYGYNLDEFSLDYSAENALYKGNNQRCFNGNYSLGEKAVVFSVPPLSEFKEEELRAVKPASLTDGRTYNIKIYDADTTLVSNIACIEGTVGKYEMAILVVDKVSHVMDDGGIVKKVYGVYEGKPAIFIEKKQGVLPDNIKQGDIGRISLASAGKIAGFELLLSAGKSPGQPIVEVKEGNGINGEFVSIYGYLYSKSPTAITTINPENNLYVSGLITAHVFNYTRVCVYDAINKTVNPGAITDIVANKSVRSDGTIDTEGCTMVYIYRRLDYAKDIVVIKY